MAQVEHPDNLARWHQPRLPAAHHDPDPLRAAGHRRAERVAFDCVVLDADGAPYLRYLNHKMKREALVPIDEELDTPSIAQQQRTCAAGRRQPPGCSRRPRRTPTAAPLTTPDLPARARRWLARCDVRDEHGRPVQLTPHQWRHTFGTRLINRDVPQEVVRRILDHDSPRDDRALRPAARHHRPPALGSRPQGRHQRPDRHHRPRRPARRGRLGQAAPRPGDPGPAQRLLRAAGPEDLPARQRLPDLPDVRHHRRSSCPSTAPPRAGHRSSSPPPRPAASTRLAEMNQQVLGNLDHIITTLDNAGPVRRPDGARCGLTTPIHIVDAATATRHGPPAAAPSPPCAAWTRPERPSPSTPSPARPACPDPGSTPNPTFAPRSNASATGRTARARPARPDRQRASDASLLRRASRSPHRASASWRPTTTGSARPSPRPSASAAPRAPANHETRHAEPRVPELRDHAEQLPRRHRPQRKTAAHTPDQYAG